MTSPEVLLWGRLRGHRLDGLKFRRQHPLGPYVLDFYCHEVRLAVEIDGATHGDDGRPERDQQRDAWVLQQGIRTLRLSASWVMSDIDEAMDAIYRTARS